MFYYIIYPVTGLHIKFAGEPLACCKDAGDCFRLFTVLKQQGGYIGKLRAKRIFR